MKRKITSVLILIVCLWMYGCEQSVDKKQADTSIENINLQKNDGTKNDKVNKSGSVGFKNIGQAPETTEKKPINEVAILFFNEWSYDTPSEPIAINIANNKLYVNPSLSLHRYSTFDKEIHLKDSEDLLHILKEFEVQAWERDYSIEEKDTYEDGVSWELWLQFEDGTLEKHSGSGSSKKEIIPKDFDAFVEELTKIVDERLEDQTD